MGSKEQHAALDLNDECFSSDHFRMYEFKVKRCPQARPHDWTRCPFAHPGEKAKRRDPRKFQYSGTACPDFRKSGCCRRGDACPFAHGVFECWCHPSRYRTQICTDGTNCKRRVCFFAHLESEVRKREEPPLHVNGAMQGDLTTDAQLQQQEAAQAYQVLLNASTQNPGHLANLNMMRDLGMMNQQGGVPSNLPLNPLAERAQQLQQQLQQLQALQAIQMPTHIQQQLSADLGVYDTSSALLSASSQALQAQVDRELLLSATAAQHSAAQASPFARAPMSSAFGGARLGLPAGYDSGLGRDLSNLSLSMSLPNPDALRLATQAASQGLSGNSATAHALMNGHARGAAALATQRQHSLDGPMPDSALFGLNLGVGSTQAPAERSASGSLGPLPPGLPGSSAFARAGSQPVYSSPFGGGFGGLGAGPRPLSGRLPDSVGFGAVGGPLSVGMASDQQRRSLDMSMLARQGTGHLSPQQDAVLESATSQSLSGLQGSLPLNARTDLQAMVTGNLGLEGLQGLSLDTARSAGLMERAASAGPGLSHGVGGPGIGGFTLMDRSASGGLGERSGCGWLAQQGSAPSPLAGLPGGPAGHVRPSRLGLTKQAFDAAPVPGIAPLGPAGSGFLSGMPLYGSAPGSAVPSPPPAASAAPVTSLAAPATVPAGMSAAALQKVVEAANQGNVYESLGRPPAIREDQQLEGDFGILPPLSNGIGDRPPSYIGRNASFDSILAELPRSLSEVAMNKGQVNNAPVTSSAAVPARILDATN